MLRNRWKSNAGSIERQSSLDTISLEEQGVVLANVTVSSLEKEYWSILVNHLVSKASSK